MNGKKGVLVLAAVAGLLGATAAGCASKKTDSGAMDKSSCSGKGSCSGKQACSGGSSCNGKSSCGKNSCG